MHKAQRREIDLWGLDESGFSPTWPTAYTWAREGCRVLVPYHAPEGRRINALGAVAPWGPTPALVWRSDAGKIDSPLFLEFLWREVAKLPAPPDQLPDDFRLSRPCVVVLDNYSVHKSRLVQEAQPRLLVAGVTLYFLPPYSPELNPMELVWRHAKYEAAPIRSFQDLEILHAAVDQSLSRYAQAMAHSTNNLRQAA